MLLYQFALLRYRHDAATGELANVGLMLWVPTEQQVYFKLSENYGRLAAFFPDFDTKSYMQTLGEIRTRWSNCNKQFQNIEQLLPDLLAKDASCFQWSEPMGGITQYPEQRFEQLVAKWLQ